jgi:hypothetical protein
VDQSYSASEPTMNTSCVSRPGAGHPLNFFLCSDTNKVHSQPMTTWRVHRMGWGWEEGSPETVVPGLPLQPLMLHNRVIRKWLIKPIERRSRTVVAVGRGTRGTRRHHREDHIHRHHHQPTTASIALHRIVEASRASCPHRFNNNCRNTTK